MPELPDIICYQESLERVVVGANLDAVKVASPFVLRTYDPPLTEVSGVAVTATERLGKRLVLVLADDRFIVIHLMIAGRFRWTPVSSYKDGRPPQIPRKVGLAAFIFSTGTIILTEQGTKRRASIHFVVGRDSLVEFDRGGLDVRGARVDQFAEVLARERHTIKRALTDPRLFDGIGNAYSDEILHRAGIGPLKRTDQLSNDEIERLFAATLAVLEEWIVRFRDEAGAGFPKKVTAFRPEMAVHGKFGEPCPVCGDPVQRIRYASNECNYCATCQTGGRLYADRALSRLLKDDWPRSLEELDEIRKPRE